MATVTATAAVIRTEARLFGREIGAVFWTVVFPAALVALLGSVPSFSDPVDGTGGLRTIDLYVSIAILMSMCMAAVMAMPAAVFAYREAGVLRRLRTTPVGPGAVLLAQALLHAAAVVGASALVLTIGRVAYDTPLPESPLGYLAAYALALVAAFSVGAVITSLVPNSRVGTAVGTVVFFPMLFTAGVWLPVQVMPDALREIVVLTPLGAASEALAEAMAGDFPDLRHLLVVAAWAGVLWLVSVRTFRWE
ncbi:ABC transporter permease [Nocardioides sp. L-11A]|uniref:ABC transporter permease n=1 Tax=Nocardioides sp. L-11A TaxID=3043848 RepID=UPI00249CEE8C|nr:ABC transporter permease [Nocardioides sp. L-11A]